MSRSREQHSHSYLWKQSTRFGTTMETTNVYNISGTHYTVQGMYNSADDITKEMLVPISRAVVITHIASLTAPCRVLHHSSSISSYHHFHANSSKELSDRTFSISKKTSTFCLEYNTATITMSISNNTEGLPVVNLITDFELGGCQGDHWSRTYCQERKSFEAV